MTTPAHLASDIFWIAVLAFCAACLIHELARVGRE